MTVIQQSTAKDMTAELSVSSC